MKKSVLHQIIKEEILKEVTRISRDKAVGNYKYWALYAKTFYEDLFNKINDRNKLKKVYQQMMKTIKKGQDRDALTFFYRIRRDELDKTLNLEHTMKKSELRQIIREEILKEIKKPLNEVTGLISFDKVKRLVYNDLLEFYTEMDSEWDGEEDLKKEFSKIKNLNQVIDALDARGHEDPELELLNWIIK